MPHHVRSARRNLFRSVFFFFSHFLSPALVVRCRWNNNTLFVIYNKVLTCEVVISLCNLVCTPKMNEFKMQPKKQQQQQHQKLHNNCLALLRLALPRFVTSVVVFRVASIRSSYCRMASAHAYFNTQSILVCANFITVWSSMQTHMLAEQQHSINVCLVLVRKSNKKDEMRFCSLCEPVNVVYSNFWRFFFLGVVCINNRSIVNWR